MRVITCSIAGATLAIFVAGVALYIHKPTIADFVDRSGREDQSSSSLTISNAAERVRRFDRVGKRAIDSNSKPAKRKQRNCTRPWPAAIVRDMIQSAIDSGSHERLAAISARRSLIAEPEIRLELLQALDWFDETAAWDALDYLSDPDAAVAGTAAQIIIRRLPEEGNSQQRGNMYSAALIAMDDAADREMLLTLLDGESLLCCRQVMHKIEDSRHRYSELWNRLNGIYHEKSGHDYTNFVDELLRK